ncbi:MAG TPA: CHAT domain-containing protein [Pyrinomonadaceae bacterium]|nr:CHAT domain-containing protein [Pyrinomonadaceae bacterium]
MYSKALLITSRFTLAGLLLSLFFITAASGQSDLMRSQLALWEGDFESAARVRVGTVDHKKKGDVQRIFLSYDTKAKALIALARYTEAAATTGRTFEFLEEHSAPPRLFALAHLTLAESYRSEKKIARSIEELNKARGLAPLDREIQAEYNLGVGRALFKAGYDISAISWLENAERLFDKQPVSEGKLDTYRFLALAWSAKLNYSKSLEYFRILADISERSVYKSRFRQALLEYASALNATGQKHRALAVYEKGLIASLNSKGRRQARDFLSSLLFDALYRREIIKAKEYHRRLTDLDSDAEYLQERLLGEAVIHAFEGRREASNRIFGDLEKIEKTSKFLIPNWKIIIAENSRDWETVIVLNNELLDLIVESNFREDLPQVYLSLATAYFPTSRKQECLEYLEKAISLIDEILAVEGGSLSLGLSETFHIAYRLLTQIHLEQPQLALQSSDYLKGRILKDRIDGAISRPRPGLSPELQSRAGELSAEFVLNPVASEKLEEFERSVTMALPRLALAQVDLAKLDQIRDLQNVAIVSYSFALDGRLTAFVWEKGKALKSVEVPVTEVELAKDAEAVHWKIKQSIFFKRDGKELFDKLLKPLALTGKHLVIIPDKHLWKIPFQALSPDGVRYLIEEKLISYSPSVSLLLEHLSQPKPNRRTMRSFSNSSFNNLKLRFADSEASSVAGLYGSRANLAATAADLRRHSGSADIIHLSMHAQVDGEQPLKSFLAFRAAGAHDGRVTVNDLLSLSFNKGSLVFLASCDTSSVLNGEGLVSLAWGAMGAGATTVISAQWEANDKTAGQFTQGFYKHYKNGLSPVEALQRTSIEMIRNKSFGSHEPYHWAAFTLVGDFR